MAAYSNFRSSTQIDTARDELREARERVLEKAKIDFEKAERRRLKAEAAGEGTWMLSSVTDRIEKEQKALEKIKKKKNKKKDKKHKKEKKKRKHDSSSSDSDSSVEEAAWVVKSASDKPVAKAVVGPTLQRDSWMDGPLVTDIIPTVTRDVLRDRKRGEEDRQKAEAAKLLQQPGQHARELNPYWKDGGSGVPETDPTKTQALPAAVAGDGGLTWLKKAYDRCKQQAQDEGRSLEEIAAERYGSLEKLLSMIKEAEARLRRSPPRRDNRDRDYGRDGRDRDGRDRRDNQVRDRHDRERDSQRRRDRDDSREDNHRPRDGESKRDRDENGRGSRDGDRGGDRQSDRDGRGSRDRERDRDPTFSREGSEDKRRFLHPRDADESSGPSQRKRAFMKPGEDSNFSRPSSSLPSSLKSRFAKPVDSDDDEDRCQTGRRDVSGSSSLSRSHMQRGANGSSWKKPEFREGAKPERRKSRSRSRSRSRSPKSSRRRRSASSSSSSSSSSSDSEEEKKEEAPPPPSPPAKVLTENEMNALSAKILRYEIMGNQDLATKLKAQLEEARKVKAAASVTPKVKATGSKGAADEEEDNTVVLTRTGRDGTVRPLPEQEYDRDHSSKKKRKMKKVDTHDKGGERARYFDDDDRHDLKTLVEMEKLGTAEDQNAMFARLAGRTAERTDDDFQVDDMFVSKAAQQQSGARNEEKERSKAIFEHKKVNAAMEKCHYCFNRVPKHLIIAIGSKVYLSLPAHKSLTPGHCLIVPMQHTPAVTAMDEDVWQEIQTFRKQLVRMFESREQDVVFMETSMHLKHFPHTVIECIPLEPEIGDMAPIYFKKAMMEAGPEWSHNKKVVDLSQKDIRHSVPKGFPYFSVDFGLQGGYAHVIEEELTFQHYFGREIVGGMIDAEPGLWRKPHKERFEDQRTKVLEFEQWWKPFDFTAQQ